jgi:hypothetical protein
VSSASTLQVVQLVQLVLRTELVGKLRKRGGTFCVRQRRSRRGVIYVRGDGAKSAFPWDA